MGRPDLPGAAEAHREALAHPFAGTSIVARAAPALVLAGAVLLAFSPEQCEDTFWHLKTGQVMLAEHRLVRTNVFSELFPSQPWQNQEWLFQVLLASAHAAVGWEGLTVVRTLLACLIGLLIFAHLMQRSPCPLPAALLALVVLAQLCFRLVARPHLLSYLLFMAVLILVERHFRRGGRVIWGLPAIFAIWANLHPEFLLGLAWLVSAAVGRWLAGRRDPGRGAGLRTLLGVTALCLVATLANPFGLRVLVHPFLGFLSPGIPLWEFGWAWPQVVPGFWILLGLAATAVFQTRRHRRWTDLLPVAWTAVLAIIYVRAIPYFLFTAVPLIHFWLAAPRDSQRTAARLLAKTAPGALAVLALGWALLIGRASGWRPGWGLDESNYPAAAADVLLSRPFPRPLYNSYDDGGYLIWRLYPRLRVFQDGGTAYPEGFISRVVLPHRPEQWRRLFDDFGINTALVPRSAAAFHVSLEEWAVVFWDSGWILLERRTAEDAATLERYQYRVFFPGVMPGEVTDPAAMVTLVAEMQRNQRERRRPNAALENATGEVLARLGRNAEAAEAFRQALRLDPQLVAARDNLNRVSGP